MPFKHFIFPTTETKIQLLHPNYVNLTLKSMIQGFRSFQIQQKKPQIVLRIVLSIHMCFKLTT